MRADYADHLPIMFTSESEHPLFFALNTIVLIEEIIL